MFLLDQESKFEREKTDYLQQNILDKILGPGKAVVIVDVEMGLQSRDTQMGMEKKNTDKKKNEGDKDDPQPIPVIAKFLVPGVPMPRIWLSRWKKIAEAPCRLPAARCSRVRRMSKRRSRNF